jgi:exodeoxyribonuclease VII large subunit
VSQFSLFLSGSHIFSVSELNQYVRNVLEADYRLQDIWVSGEISNLSIPSSGHMYFTLKDKSAALRCVMWRPDVSKLAEIPKEGEAIEAHGHISVYEVGGQYQLYADRIRVAGEGVLFQEFARLKDKLEREGLFEPQRKRALPDFPSRIGVVTSPTAAAFEDVINVFRRRYPLAEIILSPAQVQGDEAPAQIVEALQALNQVSKPDLILVVRGGGSMEDLWAFNSEEVVRAVAQSGIPVVTGIGHETDLILADFAADIRAPTPSAAAEVCAPDRDELMGELEDVENQIFRVMSDHIQRNRWELQRNMDRLLRTSPATQINNAKQQIDELIFRVRTAVVNNLRLRRAAIEGLNQTLRVVGPSAILERGFALVHRSEDEVLVKSIDQVTSGDELRIQVSDGTFSAEATEGKELD